MAQISTRGQVLCRVLLILRTSSLSTHHLTPPSEESSWTESVEPALDDHDAAVVGHHHRHSRSRPTATAMVKRGNLGKRFPLRFPKFSSAANEIHCVNLAAPEVPSARVPLWCVPKLVSVTRCCY